MADGATGDGQVVGVGLCVARHEFAAFSNVSELDNVFIGLIFISFPLLFHNSNRYRWAFVGGVTDDYLPESMMNGGGCSSTGSSPSSSVLHSVFVPHVTRIARLMDLRFTTHSPVSERERGREQVK